MQLIRRIGGFISFHIFSTYIQSILNKKYTMRKEKTSRVQINMINIKSIQSLQLPFFLFFVVKKKIHLFHLKSFFSSPLEFQEYVATLRNGRKSTVETLCDSTRILFYVDS